MVVPVVVGMEYVVLLAVVGDVKGVVAHLEGMGTLISYH